jgi:transposase
VSDQRGEIRQWDLTKDGPLKVHPLAEMFPEMAFEESEDLLTDIGRHGIREPVTIYEGKVLDGRNRVKWHNGRPIPYRVYEGDDPEGFVLSLNLHRRHLTKTARKELAKRWQAHGLSTRAIAARLNVGHATVARDLQAAEPTTVSDETVVAPGPTAEERQERATALKAEGKSQSQIAEAVGVTQQAVSKMLKKPAATKKAPKPDPKPDPKPAVMATPWADGQMRSSFIAIDGPLVWAHLLLDTWPALKGVNVWAEPLRTLMSLMAYYNVFEPADRQLARRAVLEKVPAEERETFEDFLDGLWHKILPRPKRPLPEDASWAARFLHARGEWEREEYKLIRQYVHMDGPTQKKTRKEVLRAMASMPCERAKVEEYLNRISGESPPSACGVPAAGDEAQK